MVLDGRLEVGGMVGFDQRFNIFPDSDEPKKVEDLPIPVLAIASGLAVTIF